MPPKVTVNPPENTPHTRAQPTSVSSRASSFFFVTGAFHKRADRITTKDGAVYSRMDATAREHIFWQEK